jgi:uncharacterized protein YqhQ
VADRFFYGGQAVLEGVMMKGPDTMAVAVRRPDGTIAVKLDKVSSWRRRYPILRIPVLRGVVAMIETIGWGISALLFSANQSMPDEEALSKKEMTLTTVLGFLLAMVVFVGVPTWAMALVEDHVVSPLVKNLIEGGMRLAIFLAYMWGIGHMGEIERVYQYHGAEHKVINAYEAGQELTLENARAASREHKRCGTSFLLYVVVISIFLFAFLGWSDSWLLRFTSRLMLMPVVAGLSFEFIQAMGAWNSPVATFLSRPGMWLQGLTTREPDDSQLEVALVSFKVAAKMPLGEAPVVFVTEEAPVNQPG